METLKKARYEGYLWLSDSRQPKLYDGAKKTEIALDDAANPFVVEGNLWNEADGESIYIRYADGHHLVRRTNLSEIDMANATAKTYQAHRMKGVGGLKFLQCWEAEPDGLCEGMAVMRPSQLVFVGFKREEDKQ